jgi:U4/U6.U5 tri-snRNP-associated protein 3
VDDDSDKNLAAAAVSEFVDGIVKEQQQKQKGGGGEIEEEVVDADEIEMMKKFGIPVGFESTKGKPVTGNDVSGIRAVTKRQPRQYMNRRGGFNRPLPAELNR